MCDFCVQNVFIFTYLYFVCCMDTSTYGDISVVLCVVIRFDGLGQLCRLLFSPPSLLFVNLLLLLSSCCVVQSPDSEAPSTAEVDLFMSTQRIKVLNADTQV